MGSPEEAQIKQDAQTQRYVDKARDKEEPAVRDARLKFEATLAALPKETFKGNRHVQARNAAAQGPLKPICVLCKRGHIPSGSFGIVTLPNQLRAMCHANLCKRLFDAAMGEACRKAKVTGVIPGSISAEHPKGVRWGPGIIDKPKATELTYIFCDEALSRRADEIEEQFKVSFGHAETGSDKEIRFLKTRVDELERMYGDQSKSALERHDEAAEERRKVSKGAV